jgi:hypothetical protein
LGADPNRYSTMVRGLKNASLAAKMNGPRTLLRHITTFPNGKVTAQAAVDPVITREPLL